jgi:hypothetical protein
MRNTLITISLLITFCSTNSAQAQKAYDVISYKAVLQGSTTSLQLADGYLLGSKVTIRSKYGNQVFVPSANEPDRNGKLRFDPVKGTGKHKSKIGSWLIISGLNGVDYPIHIKAVYWDGKIQTPIIFKQH